VDRISGGGGSDELSGDGGNGLVSADTLDTLVSGGPGNDRFWVIVGRDEDSGERAKAPPAGQHIDGGPGRDRIDVRNGVDETIDCGSGRDRVLADPGDDLRGCESRRMRARAVLRPL